MSGEFNLTLHRAASMLFLIFVLACSSAILHSENNPLIVVTFYSLKEDVEQLLCGSGVVHSLVNPGVDPHEYQLSMEDIRILSLADLIISTGHTHFELRIKELVERGEIKAKYVDIVDDATVILRVNPVTGKPNYHMPIRDPYNYVIFVFKVAEALSEVDPSRASCYWSKAFTIAGSVLNTASMLAGRFRGLVVVDKPHVQYAVSWLGFNVTYILKYEEEAPLTPEHVYVLLELLNRGNVIAVFVTDPPDAPESRVLQEEAQKRGIPVLRVPSAVTTGTYKSIKSVAEQVSMLELDSTREVPVHEAERGALDMYGIALGFTLGFVTGFALLYVISARRRPYTN
ncbi:MAG: zinc ABC transporter substrate-binding protein [Desulfurococcaceae archaeon]